MTDRDDSEPSRRQLAKRERRIAGDRSAELARALMKLADSTIAKLGLDDELRAEVDRARKVTSQIARRRAERSLAGALRGVDLVALRTRLASVEATGSADTQLQHQAERWRTRLIEDDAAVAEFPGGDPLELAPLIAKARSEQQTGRPPGAMRALFRHVRGVLEVGTQIATDDET